MASNPARSTASELPSHGSSVRSAWRWSLSRTRSFNVAEPALTTSTRTSAGPGPVAHLWQIVAVLSRPLPVDDSLVDHHLADGRGATAQVRHAVDHGHHQVEPVDLVEHQHVEGRGRRPFLLVAAHVEVPVACAAIG